MAQTFPTSGQVIYDTLAADATLTAALGTYTFKNGNQLPSMTVLTPGTDLPMLSKIEGVEVVIHDTGNIETNPDITGGVRNSILFQVFVICWKGATGADMLAVSELICSHFLESRATQTVAAADGVGAAVQTKVVIRSDRPILG